MAKLLNYGDIVLPRRRKTIVLSIAIGVLLLIVLAVLVIMGLAFVVSLLVSAASRQYSGRTRARSEERIVSLLPCENCGACGRPDCRAFAEDVLYRRLRLGQMNAERTEKLMPIVAAAMAG